MEGLNGALMMSERIRILVADDHFVVRMGLMAILSPEVDMKVVAEASDGVQAVQLFREHEPDVTLMDLRMPKRTGIEATTEIRKDYPDARIIVLTTYDGDEDVYRALHAGARAYLLKDTKRDELLDVIRSVHSGQRRIPPAVAARLADAMPRSELTGREMQVLELVVKGMSNKQIGTSLGITEGTVKIHVNNILSKMGVSDRTQAATTAIRRGIVHMD
jgi:DNA-binding NarL/FixJ family response regulator